MNNKRNKLILIVLIHVAIWLIITQLIFDVFGLFESFAMLITGGHFVDEAFIVIPTLVALFYWNSNFLVPRYLRRQSWWKYLIGLSISFFVLLHAGCFTIDVLLKLGYHSGFYDATEFFDFSLILHVLVVGISTSLGMTNVVISKEKQKEEAERLQRDAELKYLNAQINPHFMYNTLNGLYAQALEENAEKTIELILQLSEIMRYPLNNASKESVLLSNEIQFVENFIKLQRVRLGEGYPISFTKVGVFKDMKVPPFLIIPIVENAFKYGVSLKHASPISFHLELVGDELRFLSKNKKTASQKATSHLIGINNLKERLELIYSGKHSVVITEDEDDYRIELKVR